MSQEFFGELGSSLVDSSRGGVFDGNAIYAASESVPIDTAAAAFSDNVISATNTQMTPSLFGQMSKYAAAAGPYVAVGAAIIGGLQKAKAMKEKGRQEAANLRRRGAEALRMAEREKKVVLQREKFQRAEAKSDLANTGLFSGEESYQAGTGVQSIMDATKNAAMAMAQDIMDQGLAQKKQFDEAADAAERAGKEGAKGALISSAASVGTSMIGMG